MGRFAAVAALIGLTAQPATTQAAISHVVGYQAAGRDSGRALRRSSVGTSIRAGFIAETDFNADLRGEKWHGSPTQLGIADKMLRDPHVRQSIEYIAGPLCSAIWCFQPASKDQLDREVADFLSWSFFEKLAWRGALRRIVQRYSGHGFALEEMTDDNRAIPVGRFPLHRGGGFGLVPTSLAEIEPNTVFRWHQNKDNPAKTDGITQRITGSDAEDSGFPEISSDRFLRFTWDQQGADYRGLAVLRSAYPPWKLKQAFQTLDAIRHERIAVPTPIMTAAEDATDEDLDAADKILAEMRSHEKGYLSLPHGYTFQWAGGGGSDAANIEASIERCNKDIAINVSCGYMLLGLTGKGGSYALGTTQQTQHHVTVEGHAHFVGDGLSVGSDNWSPAERIVRMNYGDDVQVPRAVAKNLPTRDWAAIAKVAFQGVQSGTFTADDELEDELRSSMQLGPRDPATSRSRPGAVGAGATVGENQGEAVPQDEPTEGETEQQNQSEGLTHSHGVVA